jgi:glutamate formiminotransferase
VCAVTNQRILLVNDNEWKPDTAELAFEPGITVQGWADDRSAALVIAHPAGWQVVIDKVSEKEIAQEMAQRIRAKVGG